MRPSLKTVADVHALTLPRHSHADGDLVVLEEGKQIPFVAARVFTVRASAGAVRGRHAHKRCNQLLVCVHGVIAVECDDSDAKTNYLLDGSDKGLLIPASIWGTETYRTDGAVLMVLCDRRYEEDDYLRNYEQFLNWRRNP
jgi:dTDP-4-dehydrorhamnose 3,5-epimerase-like enzyme